MTPNVELKQIVSLLESSDARQGLAYEHAGDTHRLSSTSDLAHLAALAALLNHASPSVVAYGLKSIRRIGGNLDGQCPRRRQCPRPQFLIFDKMPYFTFS